jgi:hypothetical protein
MMASVNLLNGGLADSLDAAILLMVGGIGFILIMFASWQGVTIRGIYRRGLQTSPAGVAD